MLESKEEIIFIKDLYKKYNNHYILNGIDLTLDKGEILSIIGRSGTGKTTLLRCMNCLEIFDSGTIRIAGLTITRKSFEDRINEWNHSNKVARKKMKQPFEVEALDEDLRAKIMILRSRVGMVFQNLNLFPHLTVLENVLLSLIVVKKIEKSIARNKALQMLEKVGLINFIDRYPYELSGGQAQRVAIARTLALSPQIILYDEPTSALDPELIEDFVQIMIKLQEEGLTQVVVTHKLSLAKKISNVVAYMEEGKIVEIGPPEEIFCQPKDERTYKFLKLFIE